MELKGKKINFLGDSITEGAGTSCEAARFTCVLKDIAGLSEIRNYGIGGTRIARQQTVTNEKHDKNDYCGRFQSMDDDADIIVVFGGTNDYGHGRRTVRKLFRPHAGYLLRARYIICSAVLSKNIRQNRSSFSRPFIVKTTTCRMLCMAKF